MQPVLDQEAAVAYISKYASKPEVLSTSYHAALMEFCTRLPQDSPAEHAVQRLFVRMAADRDISAQEAVHLLLGDSLVGCSRSFVNLNAQVDAPHVLRDAVDVDDEDTAFQEPFFAQYVNRPVRLENVNAFEFCKRFYTSRGTKAFAFSPFVSHFLLIFGLR